MTNTNPAPDMAAAFRKKPVVITASQWFKNGDHPEDKAFEMFDYPGGFQRPQVIREGVVVRYYRHPDVPGESLCEQCGKPHHVHGWVDTHEQGHRVCPGDWIITGVKGERYPCKPDIFELTYESAALARPLQAQDAAPVVRRWTERTPAGHPISVVDGGPLDSIPPAGVQGDAARWHWLNESGLDSNGHRIVMARMTDEGALLCEVADYNVCADAAIAAQSTKGA